LRTSNLHASSFRDPSGTVFLDNGIVKRLINPIYFKQYQALKESGFFNKLFNNNLLIKHEEVSSSDDKIVIEPEQIPFISYPYEWSFNQYKAAALLTLKIQKYCLNHGFSLKDASAYNVTFHKGRAIFIDTLSFDFYKENTPWRAYKQFISHFLGPLVLARYHGAAQLQLIMNYSDGIPTKTISSLLPKTTKLNPFLYSNIHLLAKFESKHNEDESGKIKETSLSKNGQIKMIDALYDYIKNLKLKETTEWEDYYSNTNYSNDSFKKKSEIINSWVEVVKPKTLIDIGGNDGTFVRSISKDLNLALVTDIDNNAVDHNYKMAKENDERYMLPLILDVLNPSPAIGFNNKERASFIQRIKVWNPDITMALAVIHHITLTGNVPFAMSAEFFATFSKQLIIEFPKQTDSKVERLLNTKGEFKEHFNFYNQDNFETAYLNFFNLIEKKQIEDAERTMYFLKIKNA